MVDNSLTRHLRSTIDRDPVSDTSGSFTLPGDDVALAVRAAGDWSGPHEEGTEVKHVL